MTIRLFLLSEFSCKFICELKFFFNENLHKLLEVIMKCKILLDSANWIEIEYIQLGFNKYN